jgi:hypothetical protein
MDESIKKRMKEVEQAVLDLDETVRGPPSWLCRTTFLGESDLVLTRAQLVRPRSANRGRQAGQRRLARSSHLPTSMDSPTCLSLRANLITRR